ncbi:MAG: hypothetical protein EOP48_01740, partial [Sphingobacteriales bacterium]
ASTRVLTDKEYKDLSWKILKQLEGIEYKPYVDTVGKTTIGIGFNIEDDVAIANLVFNALNIKSSGADASYRTRLSAALNAATTNVQAVENSNTIMIERYNSLSTADKSTASKTFELPKDETKLREMFELSVPTYEQRVINCLGSDSMRNTPERAILLSLAYNGMLVSSQSLKSAVLSGNRAEAWYEIRFHSDNQYKRRYAESEILGLFNNPNQITQEEAVNVLKMYTSHRDRILNLDNTNGSFRALANGDLAVVGINSTVEAIDKELLPAITYIKQNGLPEIDAIDGLLATVQGLDGEFLIGDHVGDDTSDVLGGGSYSLDKSDLLMGLTGDDDLYGGQGNDVLIGGDGDNSLYGNEGNDKIYGGDNDDFIIGDSGNDTIEGGGGTNDIYGGDGDDSIKGTGEIDNISGDAGKDTIEIWARQGEIYGGTEDDILISHNAQLVHLYGDAGKDTLVAQGTGVFLDGGTESDTYEIKGDGTYYVTDNDRDGSLSILGDRVGTVKAKGKNSLVYENSKFTVYVDEHKTTAIVISKQSNTTVIIPHWKADGFGIHLSNDDSQSDDFDNANRQPFRRVDPLTLDLNGNGIDSIAVSTTTPIYFDLDGDGIKSNTGWVGPADGFLAIDLNQNGQIDNGTELFGDATLIPSGRKAVDGFEALNAQDTNNDNILDASDGNWNVLRVWQDMNQDGISQAAEIKTLASLNIERFNLTEKHFQGGLQNIAIVNGNVVHTYGSFVRNGQSSIYAPEGSTADVFLEQDTYHRTFPDAIPIKASVQPLPEITGSGVLRDLHEAASLSPLVEASLITLSQATTLGVLRTGIDNLLTNWANTSTFAKTYQQQVGNSKTVIYKNIGNKSVDSMSTTDWDNYVAEWERKVFISETFNGRYLLPDYHSVSTWEFSVNENSVDLYLDANRVASLETAYSKLQEGTLNSLLQQTLLKPAFAFISEDSNNKTIVNATALNNFFLQKIQANPANGLALLAKFQTMVDNLIPPNVWSGWPIFWEKLHAGPATLLSDVRAALGADFSAKNIFTSSTQLTSYYSYSNVRGNYAFISGSSQDDTIISDGRADQRFIVGGQGNDSLHDFGGTTTTFYFNAGDGKDTIYSFDGNDVIYFGDGITEAGVNLIRKDNNLVISLPNDESIMLGQIFSSVDGYIGVKSIAFSNGTEWDTNTLKNKLIAATNGSDYIVDIDVGAHTLSGGLGNDSLFGRSGDDVLNGDAGNDFLDGGSGADILNGGDGQDSLYGQSGKDQLNGGAGHDILWGGKGNDTLNGGTGYDQLYGSSDKTTYYFDSGSGEDTIHGQNGVDVIQFGAGITASNLLLSRDKYNLYIKINGADSICVSDAFDETTGRFKYGSFDFIKFFDNSKIDINQLFSELLTGTVRSDTLYGSDITDDISGGAGGDLIYGMDGDDLLHGDSGNDTLDGGVGNDTLMGNTGNDYVSGGLGDDIFIYNLGDGNDVIADYSGINTLKLNGIASSSIKLIRNDPSVQILMSSGESITLNNMFQWGGLGSDGVLSSPPPIQSIIFDSGEVWGIEKIKAMMVSTPTSGNDVLYGFDTNDTLAGGDGDDTIYGATGNDLIAGGAGNDSLIGGEGDDTLVSGSGQDTLMGMRGDDVYRFNIGDGIAEITEWGGVDSVEFGPGISDSQVSVSKYDSDVILTSDAGNIITIKSMFNIGNNSLIDSGTIEKIKFSNGVTWDKQLILTKLLQSKLGMQLTGTNSDESFVGGVLDDLINAAAGNDNLSGGQGNDTLNGGLGNDKLQGGAGSDILNGDEGVDFLQGGTGGDRLGGGDGSDTYYFEAGDGIDTISDSAGDDTIQFAQGINPTDIKIILKHYDVTEINYGPNDKIISYSMFDFSGNQSATSIDSIVFSTGEKWNFNQIKENILLEGTPYNDDFGGAGNNDLLNGYAGNDYIIGRGGNDTIFGAEGDDYIQGDDGDDLLYGGSGDDNLIGGSGNNTYNYSVGDGHDYIQYGSWQSASHDIIQLGSGISASDVIVRTSRTGPSNLIYQYDLYIGGYGGSQISVSNHDKIHGDRLYGNFQVRFADGTVWSQDDLFLKNSIGTEEDDVITGDGAMYGYGGNDCLIAYETSAVQLYGGNGNDSLFGGSSNDIYVGGAGNDVLGVQPYYGAVSGGSDIYQFNRGDGQDVIRTHRSNDVLEFGSGILPSDVTLASESGDLIISLDTGEKITITNMFRSDDGIVTADINPYYS